MVEEIHYTYRDPTTVSRVAVGLTAAAATATFVNLVLLIGYRLFLTRLANGQFGADDDPAALAASWAAWLGVSEIAVPIVSVSATVVFFFWLYRISANAHAMGARELSANAGLSVGAFFIPFVNFFWPPIIMGELWRASLDAKQWRDQQGTIGIALWWGLWLLNSLTAIVARFWKPSGTDFGEMQSFFDYLIVAGVVAAAFRAVQAVLVHGLTRRQRGQAADPELAAVFA
jgi:hypothetical protein